MLYEIFTTQSPAEPSYRGVDGIFKLWDQSEHPSDNTDRVKKLGNFWGSRGGMVCEFDKTTRKLKYADGTNDTKNTFVPMEPDNWIPRQGKAARDRVWAARLIAEHDNNHAEDAHRSTMVIDQCDQQNWAWLADLLWVKKLGASVSGKWLNVNGAGMLSDLCGGTASGGAQAKRAALMLNVARNAGSYTDGERAAALWHVLHIFGSGTGTLGCGDVFRGQGCLRGDVEYDFAGQLAHLAVIGAGDEADVAVSGAFFIGTPAPKPPANELALDGKSNQPMLARTTHQGLRPWVKIPRPWTPTGNGRALPTTFPGIPAGTVTPLATTSGVFNVSRFSATAVTKGSYLVTEIPRTIPPKWGLTVEVNYVTKVGGFGRNPTARIEYCSVARGGSAAPGAVTGTISKTFDATGSQVENVKLFHIPYADLVNAKGGKLAMAFYRGPDVGGDALDVIEFACTFGPEYS